MKFVAILVSFIISSGVLSASTPLEERRLDRVCNYTTYAGETLTYQTLIEAVLERFPNEEIAKALNLFSAPVAEYAVLDFYPNNYQSLKSAIESYKARVADQLPQIFGVTTEGELVIDPQYFDFQYALSRLDVNAYYYKQSFYSRRK